MECCFICDVHLGRLARLLRMFGLDTLYDNAFTNDQLAKTAAGEQRILLSRNKAFAKDPRIHCIAIRNEDPMRQLQQVLSGVSCKLRPFTRCLRCNGLLQKASRDSVADQIPAGTALHCHEYWQCSSCRQVFWKGSHYHKMLKLVRAYVPGFDEAAGPDN
ncbi:MAG TPA: Mut7-C RNAse domain-containing protein [Flavisolibacter sp.]